jgi:phosphatidate cytidylyltransferase
VIEDLDPPSFDFGRDREERTRARDRERDRESRFLPDPDDLLDFEEPVEEVQPERREPERSRWQRFVPEMSETTARVVVAIPWVVVAIALVGIGGDVFALGMVVLGILGLREFFRMAQSIHPIVLPGYAAVAGMVLAARFGDSFQILLVFAGLFPVAFVFAAVRRSHELITTSIAFTVLGVAWMGLGFSHAVLLRDLPLHGGALLIDVLVATFLSDTAGYAAGRLFGTRKITPRISPNKTLEGLIGGIIGGTLGFWFAGLYQDWLPGIDALLMGLSIAVIAPIGDLFASMLKRDLGVKDTGRLFGPHGGLIDRLDAVLFTVVAGYYLSVAFVY